MVALLILYVIVKVWQRIAWMLLERLAVVFFSCIYRDSQGQKPVTVAEISYQIQADVKK